MIAGSACKDNLSDETHTLAPPQEQRRVLDWLAAHPVPAGAWGRPLDCAPGVLAQSGCCPVCWGPLGNLDSWTERGLGGQHMATAMLLAGFYRATDRAAFIQALTRQQRADLLAWLDPEPVGCYTPTDYGCHLLPEGRVLCRVWRPDLYSRAPGWTHTWCDILAGYIYRPTED
jgi:hypothetical protein